MKTTIKTTTKKDEKANTNAPKRLRLSRETLRTLSTGELRIVAGGMPRLTCPCPTAPQG